MKKLLGWVLLAPAIAVAGPDLPPSPQKQAGLLAAVDDITRQVVALRGLSPMRPVAAGVLSRERSRLQHLLQPLAQQYNVAATWLEKLIKLDPANVRIAISDPWRALNAID